MIKILLVDPAAEGLTSVRSGLDALEDFQVVGTAQDQKAALELARRHGPQVICAALDPSGCALALTREVMRELPTPILLLNQGDEASLGTTGQQFQEAGGLEIFSRANGDEQTLRNLASRLRILAGVKVFARRGSSPVHRPTVGSHAAGRVVAIGASTGGPQALGQLLQSLGAVKAWPILCVQHMSTGFLEGMISWLGSQTPLPVGLARHGEMPKPGQVYFAPEKAHLRVRLDGTLAVEPGEPVDGHQPSATVLLSSVAKAYGNAGIGVLLTGMGADGARGLLEMSRAGATTLAQDEESSVVYGMAKQALEMGAVKKTTSLSEIGTVLLAIAEERRR